MNIENEIYKRCKQLEKEEKIKIWKQNICNTKLDVLGLYSKEVDSLIKEFKDVDFPILKNRNCFELIFIYISINLKQMKNLAEQAFFLKNNVDIIESWATTDSTYQLLKIKKFEEAIEFFNEFSSIDNEMLIRYAYLIFFKFKDKKEYVEQIFLMIKDSKYYYVNMVEAWLLSFIYINFPEETYSYLEKSNISLDIKLKAISKVCDSFRVDKNEKEKVKELRKRLKNQ
jgi:hypothetical protein